MKLTKRFMSALIFATSIQQAAIASEVQLDKIEAVVNKELILSSDLAHMKQNLTNRYQQNGQILPDPENLNKQILDKLISDKLQLQIASQVGVRISDAQLDQTLQEIAKNNKMTLGQLRVDLEESGVNYHAFVDGIRDELTISEIRQIQVRRRINISDQEVKQMIKRIDQAGKQTIEFHFAHILLKASSETSPENKLAIDKKANELTQKIKEGADITKLALANSEGPKALEGGDWGWRKVDAIPSLFATNLKESNKKGDVIGPFNSKLGVHIIKVLDKKGADNITAIEVNARHILIKPTIILSDDKAKRLLNILRQQILDKTKTFDELAKEHSQDPSSAVKGGTLGWSDPNIYVPEFRDLALSQDIGDISKPFYTTHGWHILQVTDKREADITKQATEQKAYTTLFRQRFPAEAYAWLNEIRQEAYIKISNPDYIIEEK